MSFEAIDEIERLLASSPQDAVAAIDRFVARRPSRTAALRLLSRKLRLAGTKDAATTIDQALLAIDAREPAVSAAIRAFVAGNLAEAEQRVRQVLAGGAQNLAATLLLAEIAAAAGYDAEALTFYRTALDVMPDDRETHFKLADTLFRLNRVTAAIVTIDDLVARHPDHMPSILLRLTMLGQIGEYDEADRGYAAALHRHPDAVMLWIGHAHVLKTAGRTAQSIAAYRRALALQPGSGEAYWGLADLKSRTLDAADIAAIETALQHAGTDRHCAMQLHFAAGKALEDIGDTPASFTHYAKGNALAAAATPHVAVAQSREIDRAIALFDAPFFAARQGVGCPSPAPIFILGMPRAGSTLVEQILASHSMIEGTAELPYVSLTAHRLVADRWTGDGAAYPDVIGQVDPAAFAAMGEAYLAAAAVHRKTDRPFFIDKLPENWLHVGLIHLMLPNAIIIDARRDPMACGFSNFKQLYAKGRSFSSSLTDIGHYYTDYVRLMAYLDGVLPRRIHRVQHETLVTDTEAEIRRLLAHIDVPFEPACLRFHENDRPVRTASAAQVRRPIDARSGDAWQPYAAWLGPLRDALHSQDALT